MDMAWIDTATTIILLCSIALFIIGSAFMFGHKHKYGMLCLSIALPILGMSIVVSAADITKWNFVLTAFVVIGLPIFVTIVSIILFIYNNKVSKVVSKIEGEK